jgi:formate-dependent nitrite reductase membrane component NrfD
MAAMAVLIAGLLWRRWVYHPVMAPTASEIVVLGLMVCIAAIIIGVLHPRAATLQAEAFAIKDEAARRAAFEAFFKLHMPVRALYMVNLCLGVRVNHTLHTLRVSKGQA